MTNIIFKKETENGNRTCEIIIDKNNCLGGNARGNKNYYVMPRGCKGYRVSSMIDTYKALKSEGYKLVLIH